MICFPNAKVNLGLRVLRKRLDGYHDIETVFLPIPLCDILEIVASKSESTSSEIQLPGGKTLQYSSTGSAFVADPVNDLSVKACIAFDKAFGIQTDIQLHIHKQIPSGAGLGGGSSDAAHALMLLNSLQGGQASEHALMTLASTIGSDCPFFIMNSPCHATGRGEILHNLDLSLKGYYLLLVKPDFGVSTAQAYGVVKPDDQGGSASLVELVKQPVSRWKHVLKNDFEEGVFKLYPSLALIKSKLYELGAEYASMSGSGSTMFALFADRPDFLSEFENCFTFSCELR